MRTVFFSIILLFFASNVFSQTTLEEWNYITKGYKIQIESGLDMKKGYVLKDMLTTESNIGSIYRTFNFKSLVKTSTGKTSAIMVEYIRDSGRDRTITYFCIPHKDSSYEIWDLTYRHNTNLQKDLAIAYSWALSILISNNLLF